MAKANNQEQYLKITGSDEKLPISSKIEYAYTNDGTTLELYVKKPFENMQTDEADFEAISFAVWSVNPDIKVVLKYNCLEWGNKFPLPTYIDNSNQKRVKANIQHYMRFLYRAHKMKTLYANFSVNPQNDKEVSLFGSLLYDAETCNNLCMTVPEKKSEVKAKAESETKLKENHLEKWFVLKSHNENDIHSEVQRLRNETGVHKLYDQFPCGLFYDGVKQSEEKRLFNTGYFDLWGFNENRDFCLFELKALNNKKLGIISELFFYSCFAHDFKCLAKSNDRKRVRGYNVLARAIKDAKIKAYFLVPDLHSFIDSHIDDIIKVMNKRTDGVEYSYIKFNYDNIAKDDSMINLENEWKNFKY